MLFDWVPCSGVSRGSHPTSNWLGGKFVVVFFELLWTRVVTDSQLLQSDWFTVIRHRYCSINWLFYSDRLSVWGWNAVDRFCWISISFINAHPK